MEHGTVSLFLYVFHAGKHATSLLALPANLQGRHFGWLSPGEEAEARGPQATAGGGVLVWALSEPSGYVVVCRRGV